MSLYADALWASGLFEEAEARYKEALSLQPDNPWMVNMMGVAYARLGDWSRAVAYFERAISLVPDSELAHENLARALAGKEPLLSSEGS